MVLIETKFHRVKGLTLKGNREGLGHSSVECMCSRHLACGTSATPRKIAMEKKPLSVVFINTGNWYEKVAYFIL